MLTDTIENISRLIGINNDIIPNIITLIAVVILLALSLKGQLAWTVIISIYGISMVILQLLGIESVFNIISLIKNFVGDLIAGI